MGINIEYNSTTKKWEVSGFDFCWSFDTKEEAEASLKAAHDLHFQRLKAWKRVMNMFHEIRVNKA